MSEQGKRLWSMAISYRLGLGFHALNNEGADGSNLMQPRRIDVGRLTYDGISGEIIRRHILEHFVNICEVEQINMLPMSAGLHPDRGPLGIRLLAKKNGCNKLTKANPASLYEAVRNAVMECAVLDVGGYLAAFSEKRDGTDQTKEDKVKPVAPEEVAILSTVADIGGKKDGAPYTVKRDSVFDVAWLISEQPQDSTITQHAAYRPSGDQSLFSQSMRSNIYAGVIRADLHRVGTDDYWYLQKDVERLSITAGEQVKRQVALIQAIANFIAAPAGAKVAAWAPHVFLTEGAILLSSARTAPFVSPIKVTLSDEDAPVQLNNDYHELMEKLKNDQDTWVWTFSDVKSLLDAAKEACAVIGGAKELPGQSPVEELNT